MIPKTYSRRTFLKSMTGATPRLVFAEPDSPPQGDVLVCLFQRGAADGLHMIPPYADPAYRQARPTLALPEPKPGDDTTVIDLDGTFGLHPALRPLKEIYDAGALAVVHAAGSPDPSHSHFDAQDYMERGTPGQKNLSTGWLGRHLAALGSENPSPLRAVGFGAMLQTALRGPVQAISLRSIADFAPTNRTPGLEPLLETLAALHNGPDWLAAEGRGVFDVQAMLSSLDSDGYQPAPGAEYPPSPLGQALQQAAQLIKAHLGLEIACIDAGGWDTHVSQGTTEGDMPNLLVDFAASLHAFYTDLGDQMSGITLLTMTEFGRRVAENGGAGTDHGHGSVMLLIGGGVNGGRVVADWPGLAPEQLYGPGDLAVTTDFRDVLGEVLQKRLGNTHLDQVFPGYDDYYFHDLVQPRA